MRDKEAQRKVMDRFLATPKGIAYTERQKILRKEHGTGTKGARTKRAKFYAFIRDLKSVPCLDCKQSFDPVCMDFDHRPNEIKVFNITNGYRVAHEDLLVEISKCDVVCACCHRLRTHRQRDHSAICHNRQEQECF